MILGRSTQQESSRMMGGYVREKGCTWMARYGKSWRFDEAIGGSWLTLLGPRRRCFVHCVGCIGTREDGRA